MLGIQQISIYSSRLTDLKLLYFRYNNHKLYNPDNFATTVVEFNKLSIMYLKFTFEQMQIKYLL